MNRMLNSFFTSVAIITLVSCSNSKTGTNVETTPITDSLNSGSGYSDVNGIKMYYELYGNGEPLVLIHGGGSTIQTSFGRIIPLLAPYYRLIAVELQNHGRSGNRSEPQTFDQDAEDVVALLHNLNISKASFFGFSNGGSTALKIGMHHSEVVDKLVLASAAYRRDGLINGFFDFMSKGTISDMPKELKAGFLEVNPDSSKLQIMFDKDRDRMIAFKDWDENEIRKITAPTLIVNADSDVTTVDHAKALQQLIQGSKLVIVPGVHGKYMGEITTVTKESDYTGFISVLREFLEEK
jgi:pimeloyl-ACP methyl ester carboxylesterase